MLSGVSFEKFVLAEGLIFGGCCKNCELLLDGEIALVPFEIPVDEGGGGEIVLILA